MTVKRPLSKAFIIISLFALLLLGFSTSGFSTIYYVNTAADAGGDGTTQELTGEHCAFKTIAQVNAASPAAGDSVLFNKGNEWREQLTVPTSGSDGSPITYGAYGEGADPIINGSNLITPGTSWSDETGNIWSATCATEPDQVFFDEVRGTNDVVPDAEYDWYWELDVLYCYSAEDPDTAYTSPGVEASARDYGIRMTAIDYITIDGIQIERVEGNCVLLGGSNSDYNTVQNCTFYQWGVAANSNYGAVRIYGTHNTIDSNVFGKDTVDDADGPNWAGFKGIVSTTGSSDNTITGNYFYHSGDETTASAFNGQAIAINVAGGTETISGNTIYHTGSHGVFVSADTNSGDIINIHDNTTSYTGQAGISIYTARSTDGTGGIINIYNNTISYADMVAGTTAGDGNATCGIHLNDGVSPDGEKPFVHCNVYDNTIHNCQALESPANEDSGGIALDYNADGANVYRNISYDNYGKGMYIYGGNNNNVYYNIFYGNDAGITVSAPDGETADGNTIYNNVFYKNYNGALGAGYDTEVWFGLRGDNNLFKNNILYASNDGYAYYYDAADTTGCITDYNCVFQDSGNLCYDTENGNQTFIQWRTNHATWDANSVTTDPLMIDPANDNFKLNPHSPCVNAGTSVSLTEDYEGLKIRHAPDIGAYENQANVLFFAWNLFKQWWY